MKNVSYIRFNEADILQKASNEKWIGNGTSEKPFIIESSTAYYYIPPYLKISLYTL